MEFNWRYRLEIKVFDYNKVKCLWRLTVREAISFITDSCIFLLGKVRLTYSVLNGLIFRCYRH